MVTWRQEAPVQIGAHLPADPWANLGKSAVVVEIDRLYILAGPRTEVASEDDGAYLVLAPAPSRMHACMLAAPMLHACSPVHLLTRPSIENAV